jgi:hypothetical protein
VRLPGDSKLFSTSELTDSVKTSSSLHCHGMCQFAALGPGLAFH